MVRPEGARHTPLEDYPYTYTDGPALKHTRSAGLRIDFLNEHDFDGFQRFGSLQRHGGQYRFPAGHPRVPGRRQYRLGGDVARADSAGMERVPDRGRDGASTTDCGVAQRSAGSWPGTPAA